MTSGLRRSTGGAAPAADIAVGRKVVVRGGRDGLRKCPGGNVHATGGLPLD